MVCKGGVWRDGGGGSLGGGVMVAAVFIFGYKKSDSWEPLFCFVYVFRLFAIDYMPSESLCIQVHKLVD